ncbi:MAG: TIGR03067 domain-containing protein [Acidobacteria bacterium]|nr:TIGR03067 domain-containing protein [Acidobacteriota bacterium]
MKTDLDRLQGSWRVRSLIVEGSALSAGMIGEARVVVKGDRFESLGMGTVYVGLLRIDVSRRPKTLSIKFTRGPEKGNVNQGIYELKGDRWKLCLATKGGPAPHDFVSEPGSGFAIEVLERDVNPAAPVA